MDQIFKRILGIVGIILLMLCFAYLTIKKVYSIKALLPIFICVGVVGFIIWSMDQRENNIQSVEISNLQAVALMQKEINDYYLMNEKRGIEKVAGDFVTATATDSEGVKKEYLGVYYLTHDGKEIEGIFNLTDGKVHSKTIKPYMDEKPLDSFINDRSKYRGGFKSNKDDGKISINVDASNKERMKEIEFDGNTDDKPKTD